MNLELFVVCLALLIVATLYSTVGHGGASGYLAVLSLSTFGALEAAWLKQYAWTLNLIVAGLAFWHFHRAGHHVPKLTWPFIAASIPLAMVGGYMRVDGVVFDSLLSVTLIWAAYRLYSVKGEMGNTEVDVPGFSTALPIGGGIGLVSGVVGVGGGIFLSPILLLKKWASPKAAAATAALFIWVNSAAGMIGAAMSEQLNLELGVLLPFSAAVLVGGFVGSRYGSDVAPQQIIRQLLVVVLVFAAARRMLAMIGLWP